jgi:hypothetical protein
MFRSLVIAGMHRSGTSLLASAVQRAGIDIGSELNPPTRGNPRGHFEDVDFLHFHERFMESRGITVFGVPPGWVPEPTAAERAEARALVDRRDRRDREDWRGGQPLWGFKDPRASLFLDFWDSLLPAPFYVFPFRHPVEVVLSLLRRGLDAEVRNDPWNGVHSWTLYNSRVFEFRRAHPDRCLLWPVSGAVRGLGVAISQLGERLGVTLDTAGLDGLFQDAELRQGLERTDLDWAALAPEAMDLYRRMSALADLPEAPPGPPRPSRERELLETHELLVWQNLRAQAEAWRLSEQLAKIGETRGWRLLQGYWSLAGRVRGWRRTP